MGFIWEEPPSKCDQCHSVGWYPGLSRAQAFIPLFLTVGAVCQPHAPPTGTSALQTVSQSGPTLPEVAAVKCSITGIRKITNKIAPPSA